MSPEHVFWLLDQNPGIMPAADPVVAQLADLMLADSETYSNTYGEAARQWALVVLEQRQARLDNARENQLRQQRRERLRRMFSWLLPRDER